MNTIFSNASHLNKDQRLVRKLTEKFKTRVKMGQTNLVLYKKKPGERTWKIVPDIPYWPNVNLMHDDITSNEQQNKKNNYLPPGRPVKERFAPETPIKTNIIPTVSSDSSGLNVCPVIQSIHSVLIVIVTPSRIK